MKRKITALLMALTIVFAFAACAEEGTTTTDPPAPPHTVTASSSGESSGGGSGGTATGVGEAFAQFPALVTSGGQSADYQMIGTVMSKQGMDFTLNNLATSADLGDAKTLIVVVGGSSKGLGAAGIDADGELARVGELIDAAKAKGISVIAMHTGGSARRGDLSDKFIAPVFEKADYAIVVKAGDEDGLMSGICSEKGIQMASISSISEVATVLPAVFTDGAAGAPASSGAAADAAGAAAGDAIAQFPALVTSGGQSADYQMIGTVMTKQGMDFTINNLATSADLGDAKTLIVVVGGSSKGLGAAGIDADGELARVSELIDAAKSKGMTVIAMHTGGSARRGDLSDKFIAPVFEKADYAIVVKSGDEDGLMSGICSSKGIRMDTISSISEVATVLPAAFAGSGSASAAPADAAPAAAAPAGAGESAGNSDAIAEFPALVTSGGQSADYQMIGTVMTKQGMDFTINNLATSADLGDAKTLIVVVGGSSKGLGAAGIDADGELARVGELIDAAKSKGLTVIAMHTGGSARRGDLSDKFIAPVFEKADYAIVVKSGDEDGLMSGICSSKGIRMDSISSISEVATVLPAAFK